MNIETLNKLSADLRDAADHLCLPVEIGETMRQAAAALASQSLVAHTDAGGDESIGSKTPREQRIYSQGYYAGRKKGIEEAATHHPQADSPSAAQIWPEWRMVQGDWREELVALHGPDGHIASGLTTDQAKAIIEAHGGIPDGCTAPTSCTGNEGDEA